jgi:hypothetical protein
VKRKLRNMKKNCCKIRKFPFTYLGVPLHYEKLRREDIQPVMIKIMKMIAGWKGRLLSYGARLTLLKACLASILVYLMSIIKFPKWVIKAINTQMAKKFEMIKMRNTGTTCLKKDQGGLEKLIIMS